MASVRGLRQTAVIMSEIANTLVFEAGWLYHACSDCCRLCVCNLWHALLHSSHGITCMTVEWTTLHMTDDEAAAVSGTANEGALGSVKCMT